MAKESIDIVVFVTYYLPGYRAGGPLRSIANMVEHLTGPDIKFKIVTSDRDLADPAPYAGIDRSVWLKQGRAEVMYLPKGVRGYLDIIRVFLNSDVDVFYINSFFSFRFSIFILLFIKMGLASRKLVLLAPRGALSDDALSLKSIKKKIFIALAFAIGLHKRVFWQASSKYERDDILSRFPSVKDKIFVAPNLGAKASLIDEHRIAARSTPLKVVFLSRIVPMKNLDFALRCLKDVKAKVALDVYGPVEDKIYKRMCSEIVRELPANISVEFKGPVPSSKVRDVLGGYDLFFLPSRGENFGHVIFEALSSGLPVLISDRTPWRNLNARGVGLDAPLEDMGKFSRYIDKVASISDREYADIIKNNINYSKELCDQSQVISMNRDMFFEALRLHRSERR